VEWVHSSSQMEWVHSSSQMDWVNSEEKNENFRVFPKTGLKISLPVPDYVIRWENHSRRGVGQFGQKKYPKLDLVNSEEKNENFRVFPNTGLKISLPVPDCVIRWGNHSRRGVGQFGQKKYLKWINFTNSTSRNRIHELEVRSKDS